jgi:hypothetical protein
VSDTGTKEQRKRQPRAPAAVQPMDSRASAGRPRPVSDTGMKGSRKARKSESSRALARAAATIARWTSLVGLQPCSYRCFVMRSSSCAWC